MTNKKVAYLHDGITLLLRPEKKNKMKSGLSSKKDVQMDY